LGSVGGEGPAVMDNGGEVHDLSGLTRDLDGTFREDDGVERSRSALDRGELPRLAGWRELLDKSSTADLIFPVDSLVWHVSQSMVPEAGDIVITGTPRGSPSPGDSLTFKAGM